MPSGHPDVDVAVVGDGPAGAALAAACRAEGLHTVVVGAGAEWVSTYGAWVDDVPWLPDAAWSRRASGVLVHGERRHELSRTYGIVDNRALRRHLLAGIEAVTGWARSVQRFAWGERVVLDGVDDVDARVVVDATGRGRPLMGGPVLAPAAHQVALGVVLVDPPEHLEPDRLTLMDLRPPGVGRDGPPTFAYVVPVEGGVLVEETVLATRGSIAPGDLAPRLEARLGRHGRELIRGAVDREEVVIPMGGRLPRRGVGGQFGAAAGYVHPATGYSVGAALRAAPRVARAIAAGDSVAEAVWPVELRRTRRFHELGLDVLLRLDQRELARFFDAFFDLPVERWAAYLRIDASPTEVAGVMGAVFRSAPWPVRARLLQGRPWAGWR